MSEPLVSILIPCYNAERWIAQAIQSALCQTHRRKQIFVVDDGSTDCSLEIIKSFGNRIQFETGLNRGGNVVRNRLLELATGDWVQFLDSDDYLKPKKLFHQLNSVKNLDEVDVIYSPVTMETWRDEQVVDSSITEVDTQQSLEEQWMRWQVAQTGSVLWKRKSLQAIGGWNEDYPCCQDNEVTLRAIKRGLRFRFYDAADAVYRIWSEDTVCRRDPATLVRTKTQLIDSMLDWLNENVRLKRPYRIAAGQAFFEMSRTLAAYDTKEACRYASERRKKGFFCVLGPAAPLKYRLIYQTLGFRNAERLAAMVRSDG